jgi:pyroglutamyl-peptidase
MRIFIYGFGPYRKFQDNITARIIKSLAPAPGLEKEVFPVRFQRSQFVGALKRHEPEIVLGLGQSARKKIELEGRAVNRKRLSQAAPARPIIKNAAGWLPTTLALRLGRGVGRSQNAGDYVCNYSMYVLLEHIRRQQLQVRLGFIHIPFDYDPARAARLVARALAQLRSGRGKTVLRRGPRSR